MPSNSKPSLPPTGPVLDYAALPAGKKTSKQSAPTTMLALDEFRAITTDPGPVPANAGGIKSKLKQKIKKKATKLAIDFSVKPTEEEEKLYDDVTEEAPPAADTAKEEEVAEEFDGDGVEGRMRGMRVITARHNKGDGSRFCAAKPVETTYLDEFAGLNLDRVKK